MSVRERRRVERNHLVQEDGVIGFIATVTMRKVY
jgi:hypothetical protein